MTAPDGLAVVRELLDQLDTAHATLVPKQPDSAASPKLGLFDEALTDLALVWADGGRSLLAECYGEEVAYALFVIGKAVPDLVAALRAVLDRHVVDEDTYSCRHCGIGLDAGGCCPTVRAVVGALTARSADR